MDEKYWAVRLQGASFEVQYGKLGTKGQTRTKTLASADAAWKEVRKLIREKTGKGCEHVNDDEGDLDAD